MKMRTREYLIFLFYVVVFFTAGKGLVYLIGDHVEIWYVMATVCAVSHNNFINKP